MQKSINESGEITERRTVQVQKQTPQAIETELKLGKERLASAIRSLDDRTPNQ